MKRGPAIFVWGLLLLTVAVLAGQLWRPFWFDEALTVVNFVQMDSAAQIYHSYFIPNNQVLYSILLHWWRDGAPATVLEYDFYLRLFSVLLSLILAGFFFWRFRVRLGGRMVVFLLALALVLSVPFQIYGSAIRGYILSMLLLIGVCDSALTFAGSPSWRRGGAYFLWSLGAVATIPTNLLGVGMAAMVAMPLIPGNFLTRKRFYLLGILPVIAFLLFYLPMGNTFWKVLRLNEGLQDRLSAFIGPNLAFLWMTLPLIGLCIWGGAAAWRRREGWRWGVFLLPLIPCLVLKIAPFHRVFFPSMVILLIVCGYGFKHFYALQFYKKKFNIRRNFFLIMLLLLFVNAAWQRHQESAAWMGRIFAAEHDDLFFPYYMDENYHPKRTLVLLKPYLDQAPMVYLTFEADHRALMFYAYTGGFPAAEKFRMDGPRFRIATLPDGTIVIMKKGEDRTALSQRFGFMPNQLIHLYDNGFHSVFQLRQGRGK